VFEEPITQQAQLLHRTITEADITGGQLWWRYFSLDAHADQLEVDAYLHQALHLPRLQRQLLDQADWELTPDQPSNHSPRWQPDDLPSNRPAVVTTLAARAAAHRSLPNEHLLSTVEPLRLHGGSRMAWCRGDAAFQEVDGGPAQ
jgi:hypothetical protein